jgi:DNA-binding transcriptional LysR family regulator
MNTARSATLVVAPPDDPVWDHVRSFRAVAAEGSLSAAARALGLTQPTVARHIELLETALDAGALFTRSPKGLSLTDAGARLLPHAEAMAASAAALRRVARGSPDSLSGVVRISASEMIGAEVLPPILADLRRDHPGIAIELSLSNATADLLRRDADIAVRMVRPKQGALLARKIGDVKIGLFAHRDYIAQAGMPERLADLPNHAGIGYDSAAFARRALASLGLRLARGDFAFRTDSDLAQLAALRAGLGVGGCQVGIARRDPALVHVLADEVEISLETWVVMHGDLKEDPRMRLTYDRIAAGLRAYIDSAR